MSKPKPYPEHILRVLRQREELEENDKSKDEQFQQMSKRDVVRELCKWEFGYDWFDWFERNLDYCGLKIIDK